MIQIPYNAGAQGQLAQQELAALAPALEAAGAHICLSIPEPAASAEGRAPGHPDGYTVTGSDGHYHIRSKTERGLLYGAYGLLEALGAAWPHPGESRPPRWERWPELDLYVEPGYDRRGTALTGPTTDSEVAELLIWSARRGLNVLHVQEAAGLDLTALSELARARGIELTSGPLPALRVTERCYKHSIGNPYGCDVNPRIFQELAGVTAAAAGYCDLGELGRPANLSTMIRQDLEDIFRESCRAFYLIHNGPLSWWTAPLNFDVYARTLWDLNTDPAEVLMAYAAEDEALERACGRAEEAAAAALCRCCSPEERTEQTLAAAGLLPDGLERALHMSDWARAVEHLQALPPERRGRYGDEVFLPALRNRLEETKHG